MSNPNPNPFIYKYLLSPKHARKTVFSTFTTKGYKHWIEIIQWVQRRNKEILIKKKKMNNFIIFRIQDAQLRQII